MKWEQQGFDDYDPEFREAIYQERKRHYFNAEKQYPSDDKPLSWAQLEKFFWSKLVQIGWRMNRLKDGKNPPMDSVQLVLICQKCEEALKTITANTATRGELLRVTPHVSRHKLTSRKCKSSKAQAEAAAQVELEEKGKPLPKYTPEWLDHKERRSREEEKHYRVTEAKRQAIAEKKTRRKFGLDDGYER